MMSGQLNIQDKLRYLNGSISFIFITNRIYYILCKYNNDRNK